MNRGFGALICIDGGTSGCKYTRIQLGYVTIKPLEEIRRVKSNIDTESIVELETAEVTQAGTKGYECKGDVIFTGEIHATIVRIYQNVSRN